MTDHELLSLVSSCIDPPATDLRLVRRNGRILLGLPSKRDAAARALTLYQPQRPLARGLMTALRGLAAIGLPGFFLPKFPIQKKQGNFASLLPGAEPGTCGILLGSPEHQVRRAIASYKLNGQWEVAKISFGEDGRDILVQEARTLEGLQPQAKGVPHMLGLEQGSDMTILRLPYLTGRSIPIGESDEALKLLGEWITDQAQEGISGFPEWDAIEEALSENPVAGAVLDRLASECLRPVICHGDFARWNLLKQPDGSLMVLDWEWGHAGGMPGIDLVHYFLQDARLVDRLPPGEAIRKTILKLNSTSCRDYLSKTGWSGDPILPIIACLAWKEGAGHQENGEVLEAALAEFESLSVG